MGHKEADLRITTKPVYRPDIDGMRALAILSVVIFHAFPEFLSGGFVGVDVFFVISGYLITGIILTGLQRGKFSFLQFYIHRVKRIFPALLVVLFIVFIAGWFLLLPDEFSLLGKHIFTSVLYLQNFALSRESGYFDVASGLKPLTHMWSLAVEEQFYLIFPFFLFFAERLRFNVLVLIVVGASVSFFLNIQAVANNAGVAYYLPQVRFWELLVGSFLAYVNLHKRAALFSVLAKLAFGLSQVVIGNVLSLIGLTLIGCSLFLIDKSVPFPGWWGAAPVFGAFFLILAGPRAWVNKSLLSSRYMVFVGLISYPLYLWHWPLLSFGHVLFDGVLPARISLSIVAASFVLAWLTYYLIERPVRLGGNERFRVVVMLLMSISIGVAGFYIYIKKGFPARYSEFAELQAAAVEWDYPGRLAVKNSDGISYFEQRSSGDSATLYLGDSHMEQYYPRIEQLIVSNPDVTNSAIFKTGGGCMPVPNLSPDTAHSYCKNMMFEASKIIEDRQDIDRVVIAAQWNGYMVDGFGLSPTINPGDEGYNKILKNLSDFIQGLVADGKVVYLITTIPIGEELDPKYMVQRELSAFPHVFKLRSGGVDVSRLEGKYGKVRRDLKRIGRESGALVIDPVDYLCKDRCESVDAQGRPRYKDLTHLRPTFVRNHADYLDETIIR